MATTLPDATDRALRYIEREGRPIDRALAGCLFGSAGRQPVVDALRRHYQNADGGLGHGLEPDFLAPESSPMAATMGLQALVDAGAGPDEPLIGEILGWLAAAWDEGLGAWPATPESVNDHPHAPWWHREPSLDGAALRLNPGLEIVGYFLRWPDAVPHAPVAAWQARVIQTFDAAAEVEIHQLLCCLRLAVTPGLEPALASRLSEKAISAAAGVEQDPARWGDYCLKPLSAAPSPESPLAATLKDACLAQVEFELAGQGDDGAWQPHWSWFGNYPEDWERVRPGVAAMVTLANLRAIHSWRNA